MFKTRKLIFQTIQDNTLQYMCDTFPEILECETGLSPYDFMENLIDTGDELKDMLWDCLHRRYP